MLYYYGAKYEKLFQVLISSPNIISDNMKFVISQVSSFKKYAIRVLCLKLSSALNVHCNKT